MSDIDFKALAAPIPKGEIKQRVQAGRKLDYITARTVMNRLDDVCGPANWRDEYRHVTIEGKSAVECTLYVRIADEWIGKTDVGTPSNYEPEKGVYSDALKRAAVRWGIGRELYGDEPAQQPHNDRRMQTGPGTPGASKRTAQEAPPVDPDSLENTFPRESDSANGKTSAHHWAQDENAVVDMLKWLRDVLWLTEGEEPLTWPHIYARLAKALVLPVTPKNRNEVRDAILNGFKGDKAAAVSMLKAYTPSSEQEGAQSGASTQIGTT